MEQSVKPVSSLPLNPHIAALPPYNAGMNIGMARALSGRQDIARLASNENPDGCSPAVMAALASSSFEPWRYADPACTALRAVLGERLAVDPGLIVAGNGSEEMIAAISRAVLVPGASVVTTVPSFGLHEIEPLAVGADVVKVAMTPGMGFDLAALETAIAARPRIVFISSPWNPVGPGLDHSGLQRLIGAVRPGTLLVLDEAYFEFADPGAPDGIEVLRGHGIDHVVLRTFSKAYGLAGLRVGYAVCSSLELARVIAAAKTPFNVNAAAQTAAIAALADESWMKASASRVRAERVRTATALVGLGFRVAPSQTNFLFFDCKGDSSSLAADLLKQGIIVKAWREAGYERYLRATIGLPADNDRLIAALQELVGR
ncbi:MAG: histidinol-phosphate transaminase [Mesorhizobium sp.]|uniref:histidinol-phosphate transaminase n=1 Tax=unclassified Mesorhizobium TaxID=325217 RepID=UPI000FE977D3|nr:MULTISPECIES: histidinol-phosphate transaminase [unclassified Mesorhizobium]RWC68507.1 MAG: histidinol-phosphate transaminase [Mesorhizobium sp.]RWC69066.1 MAG: histidinol-phosphate transaminase [Mesorhizobium sp.]RWC87277.1 MAG: histidinol-phosphate transaminase [Mesorhizobium sp.]TGQ79969.1 histidinol-phosphate transaminase [Mesorhizobium sp. M8A.F.Ca.ET.207.01.1.1]